MVSGRWSHQGRGHREAESPGGGGWFKALVAGLDPSELLRVQAYKRFPELRNLRKVGGSEAGSGRSGPGLNLDLVEGGNPEDGGQEDPEDRWTEGRHQSWLIIRHLILFLVSAQLRLNETF